MLLSVCTTLIVFSVTINKVLGVPPPLLNEDNKDRNLPSISSLSLNSEPSSTSDFDLFAHIRTCSSYANSPTPPPLHTATRQNDITTIQSLLSQGHDVNSHHSPFAYTPLHVAITESDLETVMFLVSVPGVDVNARTCFGETPLHLAAKSHQNSKVWALLRHSPSASSSSSLPSQSQSSNSYFGNVNVNEMRTRTRTSDVDINARDLFGSTPLHVAASRPYLTNLRMLIASGADLNVVNGVGQTPLDIVLAKNHEVQVKMLADHGAKASSLSGKDKKEEEEEERKRKEERVWMREVSEALMKGFQ